MIGYIWFLRVSLSSGCEKFIKFQDSVNFLKVISGFTSSSGGTPDEAKNIDTQIEEKMLELKNTLMWMVLINPEILEFEI